MSDLGDIHHFLGINVHRTREGLLLSQQQYALEILDRAKMLNCNPISTPIDTQSKLSATDGDPCERTWSPMCGFGNWRQSLWTNGCIENLS
jgi:hypothetical protein